MAQRVFDLVLFGATGTLGRRVAEYLATHAPQGLQLALAGRDTAKLEAVQRALGPVARGWGRLVADSTDFASLERLARQARLVVSTVGPYAKYGLPLVEACARYGTDYADLAGDEPFLRACIDRYDAEAKRTGARIVHACGYFSVPSDLGVALLHEHLRRSGLSGRMKRVTLVVDTMSRHLPHGTLLTMLDSLESLERDPGVLKLLEDPYALSPDRAREPDLGDERGPTRPAFDAWLGQWTVPLSSASSNAHIVRRTNALRDYAYGRAFHYQEALGLARKPRDLWNEMMMVGLMGFLATMQWGFMRRRLAKRLSKPGKGAGVPGLEDGHFRIRQVAESEEGVRLSVRITARGSPGIGASAKMLGAAALGLLLDTARLPERSGVLTPVTALGLTLLERLRDAGITFEVLAPELLAPPRVREGVREPAAGEAPDATSSAPSP